MGGVGGGQSEYTPLYKKDIKETQNKSMETTVNALRANANFESVIRPTPDD